MVHHDGFNASPELIQEVVHSFLQILGVNTKYCKVLLGQEPIQLFCIRVKHAEDLPPPGPKLFKCCIVPETNALPYLWASKAWNAKVGTNLSLEGMKQMLISI